MVFDKNVIKELPADQVVALALVRQLVTDHKDKVADLMRRHEEPMDADNVTNIMKLAALSEERGRYFTEDFEDMAQQANYFDTKGFIDKVKDIVKEGKKTFINAYAPGMGDTAVANEERSKGFVKGLLGNLFKKGGSGGNDPALQQRLKDTIIKDDDGKKKDGLIMGMKRGTFISVVVGIVILVIVLIVVIRMNKKNKLKEVKAAA